VDLEAAHGPAVGTLDIADVNDALGRAEQGDELLALVELLVEGADLARAHLMLERGRQDRDDACVPRSDGRHERQLEGLGRDRRQLVRGLALVNVIRERVGLNRLPERRRVLSIGRGEFSRSDQNFLTSTFDARDGQSSRRSSGSHPGRAGPTWCRHPNNRSRRRPSAGCSGQGGAGAGRSGAASTSQSSPGWRSASPSAASRASRALCGRKQVSGQSPSV